MSQMLSCAGFVMFTFKRDRLNDGEAFSCACHDDFLKMLGFLYFL